MFRSVRTVSRFCSNSSSPVPRFLLLRYNIASKAAVFDHVSSSNLRCFSSEASSPSPSDAAAENKTLNSLVKNFSFFKQWKNKLIEQDKEKDNEKEKKKNLSWKK